MPRKSSIKKLPPALRKEIDRLLADGRHTIDQVVSHLRSLGADVSRSSVGRYSKEFEEVAAHLRESREIARGWAREVGAMPEGELGQIVIQILQDLVFKLGLKAHKTGSNIDLKDVQRLTRAVRDLAQSSKLEIEAKAKLREEVEQEIKAEMRDKLSDAAKSGGLDPAVAEEALRHMGLA